MFMKIKRIYPVLILFITLVILSSCKQKEELNLTKEDFHIQESSLISSRVFNKSITQESKFLFEKLNTKQTGINFVHQWTPLPKYQKNRYLANAVGGGGVCIGDYDNDGFPDIFLTRPFGGNRLYQNLGSFHFRDVTLAAGINDTQWGTGASFVDINNDGFLDLYVCGFDCKNRLYMNNQDGTFKEQTYKHGLDFKGSSIMMAFADYDLDGDLDGYLLTNHYYFGPKVSKLDLVLDKKNQKWVMPKNQRDNFEVIYPPNRDPYPCKVGQKDFLFQNNGNGTFSDITSKVGGITGRFFGLSATWWDYNNDTYPDLYIANDFFGSDQLLKNNGDGLLTDVIKKSIPHTPWYSMGSDAADINNDGFFDLMASDMLATTHYKQKLYMGEMGEQSWFLKSANPRQYMRNALYLNTGTERFMEVAFLSDLANTDWTWSVKFGDFNADSWVDLFVSNGMTGDWFNSDTRPRSSSLENLGNKTKNVKLNEANRAYKNTGNLEFENVSKKWGLDEKGISFGAAYADLDRDGDLDLVVNNFEEEVSVYRNKSKNKNQILIRLKGSESNSFGIGSRVTIKTKSGIQVRFLNHSQGYASANEPVLHFGLGDEENIDKLTVLWPSGILQNFNDLKSNQFYVIKEEKSGEMFDKKSLIIDSLFMKSELISKFQHQEKPFDDYKRQPLLPQKLSQYGPGLAWGDIDQDGDQDFFVGNASGQSGRVYLNDGAGEFKIQQKFIEDSLLEDMGALFLDVDSDQDMDLYITSGSVESEPNSFMFRDRLYLNDGKGKFSKAPEDSLPKLNKSSHVVCAADYDRDGDLDLFVGSRSIPGKYPLTPESSLLNNNAGKFKEVSDIDAPGLKKSGLVTSALWSDVNLDGWIDLLVTNEWGPVKTYINEEGKLVERTMESGIGNRNGWWNSITGGDVDQDGDIDYVVGNVGLNTKYKATPTKPARAYYGSFFGSSDKRFVEAAYEDNILYPVRGKSCSTQAIPALGNKFKSFHTFAKATLPEIYTEKCLQDAVKFEVNTLESGLLINDGKGYFTFKPLPRIAQASPIFGSSVTDVDGDGFLDIYVVQNFFGPQPETGRMDGGLSLLMKGDGKGNFEPVWPNRSGLVVPGDAKALTVEDLNADGAPDFMISTNNGKLESFLNQNLSKNRFVQIKLLSDVGNSYGVGSRVKVYFDNETSCTQEVYAGNGYLSQSGEVIWVGLVKDNIIKKIEVYWWDGKQQTLDTNLDQDKIIVKKLPGLINF